MEFCTICHNMYYIKLDENNEDNLVLYCRNCGNENTNPGARVYNHTIHKNNKKVINSNIINEYTKHDPTLPRTDKISCCNNACISQTDTNVTNNVMYIRYDDDNLLFVYMCLHCEHHWVN
jgi:DNA-directed RNA polymerase subunit M/transcription elongation factor TFIIS